MKKNILLSTAAFAALAVMVSCNMEDTIVDNDPAGVKFTSGITATPQVRAAIDGSGNSVWEVGDPIGIYMVNNGTTTVAESASNVKYTAANAGASTSFSATGTTIYYPVSGKVDFIAYHPHNTAVANYVYPVDVKTQTSQTKIDLMWAKANNSGAGYDKTNTAAINFSFEHQLVKLIMNVSKDASVTGNLTGVSINGMNTAASFDLTGVDGEVTNQATPLSITPYAATVGSKYEAILLPVTTLGAAHTVTFEVGSDTYTWVMSKDITTAGLDAGHIYTYDITLTKHAVKVSGGIDNWQVGETGTGTAE